MIPHHLAVPQAASRRVLLFDERAAPAYAVLKGSVIVQVGRLLAAMRCSLLFRRRMGQGRQPLTQRQGLRGLRRSRAASPVKVAGHTG
jgi:hypothetical protein